MPDHLGSDMRKTKTEDKEDKPIQCKYIFIMFYVGKNPKN